MRHHTEPRARHHDAEDFQHSLDRLLQSRPHDSDPDLATLIREHGRARLAAHQTASLADYLHAFPDLPERRAPLDAAIDIALRSRAGRSRPDDHTVESLIADHPSLELPIREAAVLAHALWSTGELRDTHRPRPARTLPQPFGPLLDDGQPRYTLIRQLGAGSAGEVCLAEDRRLSDDDTPALVAVKILHAARDDDFSRQRFIEEAARARRLEHPGVVQVYDRDETDQGEDFIVYEFIPGGDLHEWLDTRGMPLTTRRAVRLVADIARAVQAAHAAGLVHLDLKPANILMTRDDHPKVADFGLARRADAQAAHDEPPLGTYAFMAPEQFLALPGAAAPPADIYALAAILYWLITGNLPAGDTHHAIEQHHAERRTPPAEPLARRRHVDRDLVAIIRRALDPDPAHRHHSAGDLADDLDAWLRREPIRWTRPGPARVLALFARRRPGVSALLLSLLIALVGALVALDAARRFADRAAENELQARIAADRAHEKELEASVAAARLEAEQQWKKETARYLNTLTSGLKQASRTGLAGEVLTSLWLLEWVYGPVVLSDPDELATFWSQRARILESLLDERRAEAGPDALETLTLETLLAFWLTKSGEHTRAVDLLEPNLARWRAKLDPTDPWLDDVETILLCARAGALAASHTDNPTDESERAIAQTIAGELAAHDQRLAPRNDGAQLRLLIHESLAALHAPSILDNPDQRRRAIEAMENLGLSVPSR